MNARHNLLALALLIGATGSTALADGPRVVSDGATGYISKISNNGKWGVLQKAGTMEGSITPGGGLLYNLSTMKAVDISHSSGLSGVADVTDDGTIVVGEATTKPAYYSTVDKTWHILPMPQGGLAGRLTCVTPDGHYAAGTIISKAKNEDQDFDSYSPVMYDLTTGEIITLKGTPKYDMQHLNMNMTMVEDMSPDGRYLIGRVSQSYIQPPGIFSFVYDRENATYTPIGFTENKTAPWVPTVDYTYFCDFPFFSPNGEWVVGTAYMVEPLPGSEFPNEYKAVYRYHVPTGEYICYKNGTSEQNVDGVSVLNDGTVIIASPTDSPYADSFVRSGDYYVSLDQILKQNYQYDFAKKTGWDNTGKLVCVADDGKTFVTMTGPQNYFVMELPDHLTDIAKNVDLLYNYSVTPAEGTVMSKLKTFRIKFDRDITVGKSASNVTFASSDGSDSWTALSANVAEDAPSTLVVTFRTRQLSNGKDYVLTIPAGMVSIKGDAAYTSKEIKLSYVGHDDAPMKLVSAYPADDATVDYIDLTNNPVILTFDCTLAAGEEPSALLYRDNNEQPFCALNFGLQDNKLVLYPTNKQDLNKDTEYKMVLAANSVTDVSGGCGNEEITLRWHGSHVKTVRPDDIYLLREDCDDYEQFMFYDGDGRTPAGTPASWGFTAGVPWYIVRATVEDSDMAYASHSMYSPAGQADDWMVSPQLFIPDESCYLTFDAQSYLMDAKDVLKVFIYTSDNVYSSLNTNIINAIQADGDLVFEETLTPGASEEGLADEWTNYVVKLDKYVGKDVYIAFANQNNDQSAIFIDNIRVVHDMHYLVSFNNAERVVNQSEITINGDITIASEIANFDNLKLTLKDSKGEVVSTIEDKNLSLKKDDVYKFAFDTPLPLLPGVANPYSVEVTLGEVSTIVSGTVKNLAFEPTKRVVLEEYSGRDCGNCPQGFAAMDNLKKLFPGKIIPVVIRTYQGDPLGTTVTAYSSYLGLEKVGAPSARINRGEAMFPMVQVNGDYMFSGSSIGDELWLDRVSKELSEPAEAAVEFTTSYDQATKKVTVNSTVRNAINADATNINLFAVVVENNVDGGYQANYMANIDDPDLGEWGKGGANSAAYVVPFTVNEVARATWGNTFNGTGGLIPANLESDKEYTNSFEIKLPGAIEHPENCEVVVMLIDGVTGKVLNANICSAINGDTTAGIENVAADEASAIRIVAMTGTVIATNARALAAYGADGRQLGMVMGNGCLQLDLNGYQGIVIVRAAAADGSVAVSKFMMK